MKKWHVNWEIRHLKVGLSFRSFFKWHVTNITQFCVSYIYLITVQR